MMNKYNNDGIWRRLKGFMLKNMHGMITCREFEDFIHDYIDGKLPDRQRTRFELHIRMCRECRQYLEAYRRSMEISRAVFTEPDAPLPDDVPEELVQEILKLRKD